MRYDENYLSDVVIFVLKEIFNPELRKLRKENADSYNKVIKLIDEVSFKTEKYDCIFFYWQGINWDPTEPEVQWFADLINDSTRNSCFVRMGEELSDIEMVGDYSNPFNLNVLRRIEFEV